MNHLPVHTLRRLSIQVEFSRFNLKKWVKLEQNWKFLKKFWFWQKYKFLSIFIKNKLFPVKFVSKRVTSGLISLTRVIFTQNSQFSRKFLKKNVNFWKKIKFFYLRKFQILVNFNLKMSYFRSNLCPKEWLPV